MKTLNIILADDHPIFLEGLRMTIDTIPNLNVLDEVKNGEKLVERTRKLKPDVIITDIEMPVMNGIEATRILRKEFPSLGILALSMHTDNNSIAQMVDAGANGYLAKNSEATEISDAIDAAYMLRPYFCKTSSVKLCKLMATRKRFSLEKLETLTEKEIEVIKQICNDFSTKEIAENLEMSPRTIEAYRSRLLRKLGVVGTAGIVVFAMQVGLYKEDS